MPPHNKIDERMWIGQNDSIKSESSKTEIASILDNSLTDEEKRIINEVPNPEIRDIIMQIINELCKRICKWENPSQNLFDNVCYNVLWKNNIRWGWVYFWYSKSIIKKLPDWKSFANLFDYDNPNNSNASLIEFRKKRWWTNQIRPVSKPQIITHSTEKTSNQQINQEIIHSALEPKIESVQTKVEPTEEPVEQLPKQPKVKAEYEAISNYWYEEKFASFTTAENITTDVPLLTAKDVAIGWLHGWIREYTKDSKVPIFDWRSGLYKDNIIKRLKIELREWNVYCIYNPIDNISHICVCGNDNDGRAIVSWWWMSMMISVKGMISQEDAKNLVKYLRENTNLKFDPFSYHIKDFNQISRENMQEQVIKYFNNK